MESKNYRVYFAIGMGYQADGTPITHYQLTEWRVAACEFIASTFGGLSTVNITGWWNSPTTGKTVHERSWGIEVYTDSHSEGKAKSVAQWLKAEFKQESILLAVQELSTFEFV